MKASEGEAVDHSAIDFRDIVDRDEDYDKQHSTQMFVGLFIESLPFRIGILAVIFLNCIVIGLQTNKYLEAHYGAILSGLDTSFNTLFAMEIMLKWYHDFLGFWRVGWNIFDFVIVAVSFFVPGVGFLRGSRVVHILRVLHAMRSLRSISTLRGLQTVVQTVVYSIPDMANVMWLLLICTFVFAILGNSIFGDECPQHFYSVERTMFSLFICVTQDGWLRIVEELNVCGHNILGPIYLVVFITLGAFIFANLVVAVVVTNLEWVIEQKNERSKRFTSKKDITTLPPTDEELFTTTQIPQTVKPRLLNRYVVYVASLEDNFAEFRRLKEELIKIQQEIQALEVLDEVSNEELVELGNIITHEPRSHVQRKASRVVHTTVSGGGGDAITEMLGLMRKSPQTGQAKSIHHMIAQLVQRKPSTVDMRRTSFYPGSTDHAHRPGDLPAFFEDSSTHTTTHRSSQLSEDHQEPRALTAYNYGNRRHTLSTVPAFRVKSSPSPKKV